MDLFAEYLYVRTIGSICGFFFLNVNIMNKHLAYAILNGKVFDGLNIEAHILNSLLSINVLLNI